MERQVKKLKITAKNIRSNLLASNKRLGNIKSKQNQIDLRIAQRRQRRVKERSLESSIRKGGKGIGGATKNIANSAAGEGGSILDKVLSVVGIILVGKAVIELPKLMEGQGAFGGVMKTLEPVVDSFKGGLNAIGDGIKGITKSVGKEKKANKTQSSEKKKETLDTSTLKKDLNLGESEELLKTIHKDAKNLEKVVGDHGISDEEIDEFIKKHENKGDDESKVNPRNDNQVNKENVNEVKSKITANSGKINPIEVVEKNKHLIPAHIPFAYQMVLDTIKKDPTKYDTKEEIEAALKQYNIDPSKIKYKDGGLISGPSHKKGGRWINVEGGEMILSRKNVMDMNSIKPIEKKYNIEGQTVSGGAVKTIIVTQRVIVPT
jgi:hypothetical protein